MKANVTGTLVSKSAKQIAGVEQGEKKCGPSEE